ncbi:MAG TPA: LLM class flavin-dependent oxidoreductase [Solirubrobacterales bacterium]|nr:LLM class flavin-dependent oxidoreductase [Solirubrobacterales bacterium]
MSDSRLEFGIILGDVPIGVDGAAHFDRVLRQVEVAQRSGLTYICIGQHFLYDDYRWLQPIPLLARLAAEVGQETKLVTSVVIAPFYHPVVLAEELATLDIVSRGQLIVGIGAGYRPREFELLQVPIEERYQRFEEALELITTAWSEDEFSFSGRFWQLEDAKTHVRPVQQPRPELWMGAMKSVGIRRAARLGDTWMVTPETSFAEVEEGITTFDAERRRCDLPQARLPIRREIVFAEDSDTALEVYAARARERYLAYAARGQQILAGDRGGIEGEFRDWARERAFVGTPAECVAGLAELDSTRLGPVIVRPSWPGMSGEEVIAYIDELGEKVVSQLR